MKVGPIKDSTVKYQTSHQEKGSIGKFIFLESRGNPVYQHCIQDLYGLLQSRKKNTTAGSNPTI